MIKMKDTSILIMFFIGLICTSESFAVNDNWFHFNKGLEQIKAKNWDQAKKQFDYYIRHPKIHRRMFGVAYFGRGLLNEAKGMSEAAIVDYKKAIQNDIHPNIVVSGKAFTNIGSIYIKNKKYEEAISAYSKAIEINPKNSLAHYYLGLAYFETKNYKEAEREADEAKKLGVPFSALKDKINKLKEKQ